MISVKHLSKIYLSEKKEALKNIDLTIKKGEFIALLGQNGAGKTTLINILAGNVKKTSGTIQIGGYDIDSRELDTKKILGIVPQDTGYDFIFTVDEALKKQSGFFEIKNNGAYIDELLEALSLKEKRSSKIRDLSGGMRRRFLIAKALVHRPEILILDEPTAGVDIEMRHILYAFLTELHRLGTTIILTTHYLEEAEMLCDRIVIIDQGRIIADEQKDRLLDYFSNDVIAEIHFKTSLTPQDVEFLGEYHPLIIQNTKLQLKVLKKDMAKVFKKISQKNMEFENLIIEKKKLEDVYLDIIKH